MKPYPAYKSSGVPWLGEVPLHWNVQRLRFCCKLNPGVRVGLNEGDFASFLPMEAVGDDGSLNLEATRPIGDVISGYTYFEDGDITIAKITPCFENGKGAVMRGLQGGVGFGTTELIVIRPNDTVYPDWLYYLTQSDTFRKRGEAMMYGAGGQKRVPDLYVKDFPIAWPPIKEQEAVATYLDRETARIDELILEKEGLIGLLRELISGETTRALTEGLSPSVELKQTNRPWFKYIPAHWELVQIRHVLGSGRGSMRAGPFGSQMTSNDMVDNGVKVYAQRHVIDNDFAQGENFVSKKKADEMTAFFVQPGDVLFTTRGTIGRCAVVPDGAEMGVLHPCLIRVRFDESRIRNDFVQYLVNRTEFFGRQLREKSNATTIEVVYTDNLRAVAFPLPPLDEQKAIVEHLDSETTRIDNLIEHVKDEIKLLHELRAATITDAVTGKIQVV